MAAAWGTGRAGPDGARRWERPWRRLLGRGVWASLRRVVAPDPPEADGPGRGRAGPAGGGSGLCEDSELYAAARVPVAGWPDCSRRDLRGACPLLAGRRGGVERPQRPQPSAETVCDTGGKEVGRWWLTPPNMPFCVCLGNSALGVDLAVVRLWLVEPLTSVSTYWLLIFPPAVKSFFTQMCPFLGQCTHLYCLLLVQQYGIYLGLVAQTVSGTSASLYLSGWWSASGLRAEKSI